MLIASQLRVGTFFEENNAPFEVLKYTHTKLGRGKANVRVRVRNLLTNAVIDKNYISDKKVERADLDQKQAKYLYRTGTDFIFLDESQEEIEIKKNIIGDKGKFLKKRIEIKILFFNNKPISIKLPVKIKYKVKFAPPDARGNTAGATYKEVVLENNLKVKTPMFIKEGDNVLVDTKTGEYIERVSM